MASNPPRPLISPTVHSNGSGADELVRQRRAVCEAGRALLQALSDAAPHGRDFYTQGPDAYPKARDIHVARVRAVQAVVDDNQLEAIAILDRASGRR